MNASDIIYKPRTGDEIQRACRGVDEAPIYLYGDICNAMRKEGVKPVDVILDILRKSPKNFILIQNPRRPNSGHWTSLSWNPYLKEIYFFSSYGGKPDEVGCL